MGLNLIIRGKGGGLELNFEKYQLVAYFCHFVLKWFNLSTIGNLDTICEREDKSERKSEREIKNKTESKSETKHENRNETKNKNKVEC